MAFKNVIGAWLLLSCMTCRVYATTFVVVNKCVYTIWPGILSNAGVPLLANGGFTLLPGQSSTLQPPSGWAGRLWGRTGCNFASNGIGVCESADCGGKLECQGAGATPPATLIEFTLEGTAGATQDYYDVSLVDGYNVPVAVTPTDGGSSTCGVASCSVNINSNCPASLQVVDDGGQVVSCKSACLAFQTSQYCCDGAYASPTTCTPTTYSEFFKAACPDAYSYAYDDPTSIFTCSSSQYVITFCPTSTNSSQKTSSVVVPANSTGGTTILNSREMNGWNGSTHSMPSIRIIIISIWLAFRFLTWDK
ncbi:hypothetical protein GOP47_0007410 [Adiantum capillus-veneris]|uniref:Thaumatin-like protein n=1 Tax=Adiantum capillus-veneris TaxID=13818 RepID=A0A9D4V188_ADICA|nr:hypothetical protein GOP47_0007410 [Adiantum capillus-veneris]